MAYTVKVISLVAFLGVGLTTEAAVIIQEKDAIQSLIREYVQESFSGGNGTETWTVSHFRWNNCNPATIVTVKTLDLTPDPLVVPGDAEVAFSVAVTSELTSPIAVDVAARHKVGLIWHDLPCKDNIGSCHYDDLCTIIAHVDCPPAFKKYGIPCHCPIKKGTYTLPGMKAHLPKPDVAHFLLKGDYTIRVSAAQGGLAVMCLDLAFYIA